MKNILHFVLPPRPMVMLRARQAAMLAALWLLASAGFAGRANASGVPHWAAVDHGLALTVHDWEAANSSPGVFRPILPRFDRNFDPSGTMETYNPAGPTDTSSNPFFRSLGTNGRACVTCHEPRSAWGVSAASIRQRFEASGGTDPIFRLVDGATCPTDDVSTLEARREAYSLLLSKGLIRIFMPLPTHQAGSDTPPDYEISVVDDPYGCSDLSANPPNVSVYRRPPPSANLRFLTECPPGVAQCTPLAIMWDGREPSLESQAIDASLIHEQAKSRPSPKLISQIVNFEAQLYDAQVEDSSAGSLEAEGARGGPAFLSQQGFYIGLNDVFGADPLNPGVFTSNVFTLYDAWQSIAGSSGDDAGRRAIARGEAIFNSKQFVISGVNRLNLLPTDPLGTKPLTATCSTCHDSPNVGNHSENLALNIGVSDANPPAIDVSGLPVFRIACTDTSGPLKGRVFMVTDPGRALITGKCADVGKVKGPILRGLAARAPYFHNGSAATLEDVVEFYNQRFDIGFTKQEDADLVAFLKSL